MRITLTRNIGMLLLAVWLILTGLGAVGVSIPGIFMAIIAIGAGVLILLGR